MQKHHCYRPQRSWGKVIFSEVCVKNSVRGGVCPIACWDTPPGPEAGTPPPGPEAVHAGRYGQQAGSTHPTGMQSCFVTTHQMTRLLLCPTHLAALIRSDSLCCHTSDSCWVSEARVHQHCAVVTAHPRRFYLGSCGVNVGPIHPTIRKRRQSCRFILSNHFFSHKIWYR